MANAVSFGDEALIALDTMSDRAGGLLNPSLRLGVTGLSRAGKTVFITSLVHNLIHGGRLPLFEAQASQRITRANLQPQPDDGVPRFAYEDHIRAIVEGRNWPDSTRAISQLRLKIDFESASAWSRIFSGGTLNLDIVDYPGEWLLDLPLLSKSYRDFCAEALNLAKSDSRAKVSKHLVKLTEKTDPHAEASESTALELTKVFTEYLRECRRDDLALSTLPPGRFLMPGDMEGSPALTFAPLEIAKGQPRPNSKSLYAMMERRYEAYKTLVVKPFFREHITRLDRQIVLIDAMHAINAGSEALADLQRALSEVMMVFRTGTSNPISAFWRRRIDRILIAATKADHLHHTSHNQLEGIVRSVVDKAMKEARFSGAQVSTIAMAAVRSTREAEMRDGAETLPVVVGTPSRGEMVGGETFDGATETAVFPGDLPHTASELFSSSLKPGNHRFVKFRPPNLEVTADGLTLSLPHIRLDKALEFLVGDRLA